MIGVLVVTAPNTAGLQLARRLQGNSGFPPWKVRSQAASVDLPASGATTKPPTSGLTCNIWFKYGATRYTADRRPSKNARKHHGRLSAVGQLQSRNNSLLFLLEKWSAPWVAVFAKSCPCHSVRLPSGSYYVTSTLGTLKQTPATISKPL